MEQIITIKLTPEELKNLIRDSVREELNTTKQKELLNFKETRELLGVSVSCLNQWKAHHKIPFKKLGKRIFFSRTEVLAAMKESNFYKMKELRRVSN